MDAAEHLAAAADDGPRLLAAAETGWDRPVRHCPGWDAAELVRHMGGVLEWMAAVVRSGDRVARRSLPGPPEDVTALPAWYRRALDQALDVLGATDPDTPTWTFAPPGSDRRVRWWCRRVAMETAVHRWDAEEGAAGMVPSGLGGELAADGIEEFVTDLLPTMLGSDGQPALTGTLHLHATDGPCEWWIDLGARRAEARHAKADTAVRATRSDLLLWLVNREPADPVEVLGDRATADRWGEQRF